MQTNMGENVRRLRTVKGLTQEQLAQAIGISQPMIMRIENGSKLPGIPYPFPTAKSTSMQHLR